MVRLASQSPASPLPNAEPHMLHGGGRWLDLVVATALFALLWGVYYTSQDTIPQSDSMWTLHVAMSIVKEGNTDLDEFEDAIIQRHYYGIQDIDGHLRYWYPLGTPILAAPFVYAAGEIGERLWSFDLYDHLKANTDLLARRIELGIAALFSALFCIVVFFTSRLFMGRGLSLILALIAAFCTPVWSTTSRGLWQHGPSILMLACVLLLVLMAEKKPWLVQFASLPLAFSWVIRPTNIISIALLSAYVLLRFRKYFLQYLLWAMLVAIPVLLFNLSVYNKVLPPYYLPSRVGSVDTLWEALAGNLVSPARGLLVYSPVFLFAAYGLVLKIKNSEFKLLDAFLLGTLALHWIVISASREGWWAGHSYGPRLFSEMLPFLLYFLIPTLGSLASPMTARKAPLIALFALSVGLSFFMHFRGATVPAAAIGWNWQSGTVHSDVNEDPSRLWDWSDPPFLRGLRPAILDVAPRSLSLQVEEGLTRPQFPGFVVANVGDRDLTWQAKTPYRVQILSTSEPQGDASSHQGALPSLPPGSSTQPLTMMLDLEGLGPGVHSLGAILVSAGSVGGQRIQGSPIAIPIALEILPDSSQPAKPLTLSEPHLVFIPLVRRGPHALVAMPPDISPLYAPPPDILVNGGTQSGAEDQVQAFYGAGWYDLEHLDAYSWRWAKSPAEIYVYSPSRRTIRLESRPVALFEAASPQGMGDQGILTITTNQQSSTEVLLHREQAFAVPLDLLPGWNVITFEWQAGSMQPAELDAANGDLRWLSLALDTINLTGD